MIVKILSQQDFNRLMKHRGITEDNVETFPDLVLISIIGSWAIDKGYFTNDHSNVLNLQFDDVSDVEMELPENQLLKLFTDEHAEKLVDFLERNKGRKECFVHCSAGISRSGAVGTFANDFYGSQDYFTFMSNNKGIQANGYVLALLKRKHYGRNSISKQ